MIRIFTAFQIEHYSSVFLLMCNLTSHTLPAPTIPHRIVPVDGVMVHGKHVISAYGLNLMHLRNIRVCYMLFLGSFYKEYESLILTGLVDLDVIYGR